MTNIEQKIWELCGSPIKTTPCFYAGHEHCECPDIVKKIDIGLAHVMQLLKKCGATFIHYAPNKHIVIRYLKNGEFIDIYWWLLNENNEAALLRDQSEETQRAVLEVGKNAI